MVAPKIAIIGSGPSGCYTAQFLNKALPEAEICVIDRLPVPFGLIRYGVAPDHVGTKNISKQFERLFAHDNVHFVGNLNIGADISLAQLQALFDVVVLATGLHQDRKLNIEGEHLQGVIGSGAFTRWCNSHPEHTGSLNLGKNIVIVGNGNVAIDVARLLSKAAEEFAASEINPDVLSVLQSHQPIRIDVVSRSSMDEAKYDAVMVKELAKTQRVKLTLGHGSDEHALEKSALMHELSGETSDKEAAIEIGFHYGLQPQRIEGDGRVTGMAFVSNQNLGEVVHFNADCVITAIGFQERDHNPLAIASLANHPESNLDIGQLQNNLFCVGWARRGPVGTIPENRKDAKLVADAIVAQLGHLTLNEHTKGHQGLISQHPHSTDFSDWNIINQFELEQAAENRSRHKVNNIKHMLDLIAQAKQSA